MYYPAKAKTDKAIIVALGDSDHNLMIKGAAKYIKSLGCNVLAITPTQHDKHYTGYHNFPLECIEAAVKWLKNNGSDRIGMTGGSTTGMLSLIAASYIPNISLVLAYAPSDFVMQGFYRGDNNGISEWPAEEQSTVSWRGKPVPYAPFNLDNKAYYDVTFGKSTKEHGEIYSLLLFEHVEKDALDESAFIKVEDIKGKIVLFATEDDTLWYTARYCRRMTKRLEEKNFPYPVECHIYEKGTHFIFPQGMLKAVLPFGINFLVGKMFVSGKRHPKECEAARIDVDKATASAIRNWQAI